MKKKKQPIGSAGGIARAKALTQKQRSAIARMGGLAVVHRRHPTAERCLCDENTLKRAKARAFDCCKRNGKMARWR